jgi:DNA polymerase III subunit delta
VPPSFKPAYLIHGDDHGRIAERRARLRALAEQQSGAAGVELFEGDAGAPDAVAAALNAMTFALGRRFMIVDGVERWKERELDALQDALKAVPDDTTIAFFAREEGRTKAPARLAEAVRRIGGDVAAEDSVKPWELPKWVIARAAEMQLKLASDAARALISHVGERQQRLLRELEKLALELGPGAEVGIEEVLALTAPSAELRSWALADAVLTGDPATATRVLLSLRDQGERVGGLVFWLSTRLREAHRIAVALESGQAPARIKSTLRMPSRAADQLIARAGQVGSERLRLSVAHVADLELATRGGGAGPLGEDTAALLAVLQMVGA